MRSDVIPSPRPLRPRQEPPRAVESHPPNGAAAAVEPLLSHFFGGSPPVRVQFWDGTTLGPVEGDTLEVQSRDAVRRLLWSPDELGLARAFVAGDLDFDGDMFEMLARCSRIACPRTDNSRLPWQAIRAAYRLRALGRPIPPPPEEAAPQGRDSRTRDARWCDTTTTSATTSTPWSRALHDVLLRAVFVGGGHLGSGSGVEARSHLSQARPQRSGRTANPRCRLRMGQLCHPRSAPLRRGGGRRHPQPRAGAVGTRAGGSIRVRSTGRDPAAGLPRRPRRDLRRHFVGGYVRARRILKERRVLRSHAPTDQARGQAAQPRHLERGRIEHRLEIVHRALRLPRRRAHRRGQCRTRDGGSGL